MFLISVTLPWANVNKNRWVLQSYQYYSNKLWTIYTLSVYSLTAVWVTNWQKEKEMLLTLTNLSLLITENAFTVYAE